MSAVYYHAGMNAKERQSVYAITSTIDAYYQEIGRAGRDGQWARALLFYRPENLGLLRFFAGSGQVDVGQVVRVAEAVHRADMPLSPEELRQRVDLSRAKLTSALSGLDATGAVAILPTGEATPSGKAVDLRSAAEEATRLQQRRRWYEMSRLEIMRGYAEAKDCRRRYLLTYFGEKAEEPCGFCDRCEAGLPTRRGAWPP